ncbi:MAG: hypothetical protein VKJ02_16450 [Snowella sp.]|nr:hypothetical protein [Snowella sp.]
MLTSKLSASLLIASLVVAAPVVTLAGSDIRTERVQFKPGTSGKVIKGTIKGYQTVDYVINARKDQSANISMASKNTAAYFNILAPGEKEVAMFNGSMNDNQFEGTLPKTGDYKVRVYLMRSAARRNEVANYTLDINISD